MKKAKTNEKDNITIEFEWLEKGNKRHKNWNNTVFGHITIKQETLILETNSLERGELGKKKICQYLDGNISFQNTVIETPEQKMKSFEQSSKNEKPTLSIDLSEEKNEAIKAMVKLQWENWFDEPIPILNDQTPREASTTKKGRERLEAVLLLYEQHDFGDEFNLLKPDVHYLRERLGLTS